jgi:mannose-6-phosphate isomerase
LYVGLKRGVTRAEFERKIQTGEVAECFHRVPVKAGDTMFLPSGRVHAIGAGLVIFEIQQNSDTTYRVFDWNRVGLDKKPRELHVAESLASIDFQDFEPTLVESKYTEEDNIRRRHLVKDSLFEIEEFQTIGAANIIIESDKPRVVAAVQGRVLVRCNVGLSLSPGEFCLIPASSSRLSLSANAKTTFLLSTAA